MHPNRRRVLVRRDKVGVEILDGKVIGPQGLGKGA